MWSLPDEWLATRQTVGTFRDPWSWYLSFYSHLKRENHTADLAAYGGGKLDFESFLYGATHGRGPHRMCGLVYLPYANGKHFADSGLGLCSWMHRHFYAERFPSTGYDVRWLVDVKIRTDRLTDELGALLGGDASQWPPRNVARNKPPIETAYTLDSSVWVALADREYIAEFGWEAP